MVTNVIRLTDQQGRDVLVRTDAFVLAMPYEGEQVAAGEGVKLEPVQTVLIMANGTNVYVSQGIKQIERMRAEALREIGRLGS